MNPATNDDGLLIALKQRYGGPKIKGDHQL
jgi:hypothetical protein